MTNSSNSVWYLRDDGWLSGAAIIPSPNHDARPAGEKISLIVIHAISLPPGQFGGEAVIDFFTNRLNREAHPYFNTIANRCVSAHFYVRRNGQTIQFVSCLERAWHAGISCWRGRERCNDFSIGIELEGDDCTPFTKPQYDSLTRLIVTLRTHYSIEGCLGHADIAPGRKSDPGPYFEWESIYRATGVRVA